MDWMRRPAPVHTLDSGREENALVRRSAFLLILFFWSIQFAFVVAMQTMRPGGSELGFLAPAITCILIGIFISVGMVALQSRAENRPVGKRIAVAIGAAVLAALVTALTDYITYFILFVTDAQFTIRFLISDTLRSTWFFISMSAAILAVSYGVRLSHRERHMAALAAKVHSAQMRALRHQLNPHFLFNTLNSIAALIRGGDNGTAETMIENLSDFMRTGFALDPHDDISLARELDLQRSYLDIERLRFPDRILVTFDIPEPLQQAMVPALITQPIVENTIKYAVARSTVPVHIDITARERDGLLILRIGDDGGDAPAADGNGTKVGLSNIESRLRARFGDRYRFRARPWPGAGFEVELGLPLPVED